MNMINFYQTKNKMKSLSAAMVLALFAFASCSGVGGDGGSFAQAEQAQAQALSDAYVTLSLSDAAIAGGVSANTQADATSVIFGKFDLAGTSNDAGVDPVSWSCGDGMIDAKPFLADAKIPVKKGASYTFTLTATAIGGAVYTATDDITIQAGANTLSFTLVLVNSGGAGAKGSAQIEAVIPQGTGDKEVKRVTVAVYSVNDSGDISPSAVIAEKEIPLANGKAVFDSGSLDAGFYCAVFRLYGGRDASAVLNTWREFFAIAGGVASKGTINPSGADILDPVYTIDYKNMEGGTLTAPGCYTRQKPVTLADIFATKDGHEIEAWFLDSARTQKFSTTAGMSYDINLYPKWRPAVMISITQSDETFKMSFDQSESRIVFAVAASLAAPSFVWKLDGAVQSETSNTFELAAAAYAKGVHVVSATCFAGGIPYTAQATVWQKTRPTAPDLSAAAINDESAIGAGDGSITNLPQGDALEYSTDGNNWIDVAASQITGLAGGTTVYIRKKATVTTLASPAEQVDIKTATYTVSLDAMTDGSVAAQASASPDLAAVKVGDTVTLAITPDAHCSLDSISASGGAVLQGEGDTRTFVMPASDVGVRATFVRDKFVLTYSSSGEHGSITSIKDAAGNDITSGDKLAWGTEVKVAVELESAEYFVDSVTVNGDAQVVTKTDNVYSFDMPAVDAVVLVAFKGLLEYSDGSVGDIVLANKKYAAPSNYAAKADLYKTFNGNPVGVVAYEGVTGSYGKTGFKYMIGLKDSSEKLKWTPRPEPYDEQDPYATVKNSSETEGEGNWAIVAGQDQTAAQEASTYYPALNYANNYMADGTDQSLWYNTGWFVPSLNELKKCVEDNYGAINAGLNAANGSDGIPGDDKGWWTSSINDSCEAAYFVRYKTSEDVEHNYVLKDYLYFVCCMRKLPND